MGMEIVYYNKYRSWGLLQDGNLISVRRTFCEVNSLHFTLTGHLFNYYDPDWPAR
jgi:hypothetical protein